MKKIQHNFYLLHTIMPKNGLIDILKDGYIRKGTQLKPSQLGWSYKGNELHEIYGHIYFDDIKNIDHFWSSSIILSPQLLYDYGIIFRESWQGTDLIKINKHDSEQMIKKKLQEIKEILKTKKSKDIQQHEIVIKKQIPIKKYAIGLSCNEADDKTFTKIQKIVKEKGYNLYIERHNANLPTLKKIENQRNICAKYI